MKRWQLERGAVLLKVLEPHPHFLACSATVLAPYRSAGHALEKPPPQERSGQPTSGSRALAVVPAACLGS